MKRGRGQVGGRSGRAAQVRREKGLSPPCCAAAVGSLIRTASGRVTTPALAVQSIGLAQQNTKGLRCPSGIQRDFVTPFHTSARCCPCRCRPRCCSCRCCCCHCARRPPGGGALLEAGRGESGVFCFRRRRLAKAALKCRAGMRGVGMVSAGWIGGGPSKAFAFCRLGLACRSVQQSSIAPAAASWPGMGGTTLLLQRRSHWPVRSNTNCRAPGLQAQHWAAAPAPHLHRIKCNNTEASIGFTPELESGRSTARHESKSSGQKHGGQVHLNWQEKSS